MPGQNMPECLQCTATKAADDLCAISKASWSPTWYRLFLARCCAAAGMTQITEQKDARLKNFMSGMGNMV